MLTVRLERLGLKAGDWVLDLGCGEGRHVHGLHVIGGINVVGLDMDPPSLAKGRDGLSMLPEPQPRGVTAFLVGDAYRLPFPDAAFDAVICSEVLEHLHGYRDALAEIRRVLKPGGAFVPTVPRAWPERICWTLAPGEGGYADQPGGHIRIFAEEALKADVSGLGFSFLGKHYAHALHAPYWWLKCAFWGRDHVLVRLYHRLQVWDLLQRPWLTRALERLLDPVMGKSVAFYFRKVTA